MQPILKNTLQKLAAGEKVTIVALGDSNTELTWHTAGRLNWVGLLQEAIFERFGRNRATIINSGCSGATAPNTLERLKPDVLTFHPDLVIVSLGSNDAFAPQAETKLNLFNVAMREIVSTILERDYVEVLLRTPSPVIVPHLPQTPPGYVAGYEWPAIPVGLFASCTVQIATELHCPVVDHYTQWLACKSSSTAENTNHLWMRMSDSMHPNALGHLHFYRELAPFFELPLRFPWEA